MRQSDDVLKKARQLSEEGKTQQPPKARADLRQEWINLEADKGRLSERDQAVTQREATVNDREEAATTREVKVTEAEKNLRVIADREKAVGIREGKAGEREKAATEKEATLDTRAQQIEQESKSLRETVAQVSRDKEEAVQTREKTENVCQGLRRILRNTPELEAQIAQSWLSSTAIELGLIKPPQEEQKGGTA